MKYYFIQYSRFGNSETEMTKIEATIKKETKMILYKITDQGIRKIFAKDEDDYKALLESEPCYETIDRAIREAIDILSARVCELENKLNNPSQTETESES